MIPIIYAATETTFASNGLGRLVDCIECTVTEERNGIYECEFKYPVTGIMFDDIQQGRIISVTHDEQGDRQPFVIYRSSAPVDGVVTFNAHHISYRLSNVILRPFTATSAASALAKFETEAITEQPFSFWTDKASAGSFSLDHPASAKAMLGGVQGSILDAFGGGEYEFDKFLVKLYQHRGSDNGVTIRYGKNLTNITDEIDTSELYNAVVPFWSNPDGDVVYGGVVVGSGGISFEAYWTDEDLIRMTNENGVDFSFGYAANQVVPMDLSQEFQEEPTVEDLEARALAIMESNDPWVPKENIKVDFVALWQTEEYANVAPLERVRLCDTVTINYTALNVNATAKVIKTVYNVLRDRYDSIELGDAKTSFAEAIMANTEEQLAEVPSKSMMQEAIDHATALITGGLGGHVVFRYDADGKPTEILVMDTEDEATAVHVLRINVNGIGFSSTGVSGQYSTAWTLDGSFVANWITAGELSANRIKGGTLTLGGPNNGNGSMEVLDSNGRVIGVWNNNSLITKVTSRYNSSYPYYTVANQLKRQSFYIDIGYITTKPRYYETAIGLAIADEEDLERSVWDFDHAHIILGQVNYQESNHVKSVMYEQDTYQIDLPTTEYGTDSGRDGRLLGVTSFSNVIKYSNGKVVTKINYGRVTTHQVFDQTLGRGVSLYFGFGDRKRVVLSIVNHWFTTSDRGDETDKVLELVFAKPGVTDDSQGTDLQYYELYVGGKQLQKVSSSSKRYKHDITAEISEELDPRRLYDLKMKQYVFNDDLPLQYQDMRGQKLPGFIAEDVAEVYPAAVIHKDGEIENWDERRIIPGMLQLIQEQKQELDELKERLARLEHVVEALTNDMR